MRRALRSSLRNSPQGLAPWQPCAGPYARLTEMKMNKTSEQESNPPENISNYKVRILIQPRTGPCAWLAEVKIKKVPEQESNPPETDPSPESVRGQVHEPMRARWPRLWRAMYVSQDDFSPTFSISDNFVQFVLHLLQNLQLWQNLITIFFGRRRTTQMLAQSIGKT